MHAVNEVLLPEAENDWKISREWWVPIHWREQAREEPEFITRRLEEDFGFEPRDLVIRPPRYDERMSGRMTWTYARRTKSGRVDARFRPKPEDPIVVSVEGKFPYGGDLHQSNPLWRSGRREVRWYMSAEAGPVIVLGTSVRMYEDWPKHFEHFGVWLFPENRERWPDNFPDGEGGYRIARVGDGSYVSISQDEYAMLLVAYDALQDGNVIELEWDKTPPDWN